LRNALPMPGQAAAPAAESAEKKEWNPKRFPL
jgi:hypothetical protein